MLFLLVGLRFYFWNNFVKLSLSSFERSISDFILLIISVGFISAGGYLINDIFDVDVDRVNKPAKKLPFSIPILWFIYFLLNTLAIILAFFIVENNQTTYILIGSILLLFLYSAILQKLPLIGNLSVAFLASILPFLFHSFDSIQSEWSNLIKLSGHGIDLNFGVFKVLFFYSFIGFGVTFLREVVKDLEDLEGDNQSKYKTFPVMFGLVSSKVLFYFITFFIIAGLYFFDDNLFDHFLAVNYIYYIPTFIFVCLSLYSIHYSNFSKSSLFLKLALFSGVIILFLL